jgi:RraA family protein
VGADGAGAGESKPQSSELHPGPGWRIRTAIERPAPELVAGIGRFETPAISDLMNRLFTLHWEIHRLTAPGTRVLGPACTVKVFPGDNLMVHKSLDLAQPGDIVVVDAAGTINNAVLGDLVATKARHRGIGGFVVDGLIRDLPGILALGDLPVFARGVSPIGPLHRGPGEVNFPVSVGGIVINPGDLVVGDDNGVVVVPRGSCAELLARLEEQSEGEAGYVRAVAEGRFSNAWVDEILSGGGAVVDDGPDT